ncbi:hypothetical protein [Salmonella enterica]|nr:hypothetical protein [Salmonella enterica]
MESRKAAPLAGVAIEDGVIEPHEKAVIDEELYQAIAKLQQP